MKIKIYNYTRITFSAILLLISAVLAAADSEKILINEFMAINNNTLQDEDGNYPDWIELYNPGAGTVDLNGWFLSDNAGNLQKWKFPAKQINAGEYLIIFASGKDRTDPSGNLHTDFKLSGSGEYLALTEPDGTTISYSYSPMFPAQREDISYGIVSGQHVFLETPTPGGPNSFAGQVFNPVYSIERGFYESPFDVELSTADQNLKIYYTTDGTRPDSHTGMLYSGPIHIATTTPLSAITIDNSGKSSEVITHTYLFTADIVKQSNNPPGYPDEWSPFKYSEGNAPADYEMDPEVCDDPDYEPLMNASLTVIPSLSLVTNRGYLFSHSIDPDTGGIYIYTGNSGADPSSLGIDWERQISAEYIDPLSSQEFQINCGLRLHGGNSRVPMNSQKHSFRIVFRSEYGPSKLNFNLFKGRKATNEFNTLVLRSGYNYSWMHNNVEQRIHTSYTQDPFAKNTQLDMGDLSPHNRFVHLYINGIYWGVYCITEKVNDDFVEAYWGGSEKDYDVVKDHTGLVDGNRNAWDQLMSQVNSGLSSNSAYFKVQGRNSDGTINAGYANLLDVDNLINYIIFNCYIGNIDWDHNNWLAARNRVTNKAGFRFFSWDGETSLTDVNINMVDDIQGEPTTIYSQLRENGEFRLRFADHLREHFFNGGALTPDEATDRFGELYDNLNLSIISESARWGDYRRDVQPRDDVAVLYTRNDHWLVETNSLMNNYFPDRSDIVFNQFKDAGLYPDLDAPNFSQYGGELTEPIYLEITAPLGDIYYSTDDEDPREVGGTISASHAHLYEGPVLIDRDAVVKARARSGSEWSAMTMARFNSEIITSADQGELTNNLFTINTFPNPFKSHLYIQCDLPEQGDLNIQIISIDGRIIESIDAGKQPEGTFSRTLETGSMDEGVYFIRITHNRNVVTRKIVKVE